MGERGGIGGVGKLGFWHLCADVGGGVKLEVFHGSHLLGHVVVGYSVARYRVGRGFASTFLLYGVCSIIEYACR